MKFKELREANLTKMQIKKVHDKADDLPKNDFIKRYGKDGDSVRFATATKMVKKELGIEDYEEGFKSDAQRRAAFASGYKEKGKKKNEGGPGSGPRHKEVTLTRNGKTKTVKGVAAKIFTDAGWKMKEEVELDEVHFSNRNEPPAPKGMHKLRSGRDIPSTPQVDKIHKKVVAMTDRNDHSGARIEIAKACGDKQLVQIFSTLELIHDKYSDGKSQSARRRDGSQKRSALLAHGRKSGTVEGTIEGKERSKGQIIESIGLR